MGFNWNDSPVKKVAEDIRDNGEKPLLTQDTQQEEKSVVVAENGKEVKSEKESTTEPTNEGTVDNEKNEAKEENEVAETKVANTSAPAKIPSSFDIKFTLQRLFSVISGVVVISSEGISSLSAFLIISSTINQFIFLFSNHIFK